MNRRGFLAWIGLGALERMIPAPVRSFLAAKAIRIDSTETFTVKMRFPVKIKMVGIRHKPI